MSKVIKISIQALAAAQRARISNDAIEISDICIGVILPTMELADHHQSESESSSSLSAKKFYYNEALLVESLVAMKGVLEKIASKTENYFCTFKYALYMIELKSLVQYLRETIDACTVMSTEGEGPDMHFCDPLCKMFALPHSPQFHIPHLVSRLFWIKCFKLAELVDWKDYIESFVLEYGAHHPYCLNEYKDKLCPIDRAVVTLDNFMDFGAVSNYGHGSKISLSAYEAFQIMCNPGTQLMMTGLLIEGNDVGEDIVSTIWVPQPVQPLLGLKILQVACGGQHVAVLGAEGSVYTWGRGGFGRLGHGNTESHEVPRVVASLKGTQIIQIACGFAYSAAITAHHSVYMWGTGDNGRLGTGDTGQDSDKLTPVLIESFQDLRIVCVQAGSVHTAFLSSDGILYTCGKSEYCGHGTREDVLIPKALEAFDGVPTRQVSVGPGGYHTIALTVKNDVYTWGHNRVGQLGHINDPSIMSRNSDGAFYLPRPRKIERAVFDQGRPVPGSIASVNAGWGHSCCIMDDGVVFVCGRNVQGQLGLGDPEKFPKNERGHSYQPNFIPIAALEAKHILHVALGGEHSVFVSGENEVFVAGEGSRGQLGTGEADGYAVPTFLHELFYSGSKIYQVACGNSCSMIITGNFNPLSLKRLCLTIAPIADDIDIVEDVGENNSVRQADSSTI